MNNQLTWEQNVRVEALNAAVRQYTGVEFDGIEVTLDAAEKFEKYILDGAEASKVIVFTGEDLEAARHSRADMTGFIIQTPNGAKHTHLPRQHRDRKPPWCDNCHLTAFLEIPVSGFDRDLEN